jgi:subtilisin family serine protease
MSPKVRIGLTVLAVSVVIAGSFERRVQSQSAVPETRFVAGELLIKFRPEASEDAKAAARAIVGAARRHRLRANGSGELELAALPARARVLNAISLLQRHPAVAFAEPNWIYTHQDGPDDPLYTNGSLWGMYGDATSPANAFGSQAGEAWAAGNAGSLDVYIGVIDEGIDLKHPDLAANIWTNPHDLLDGVDNDGNGYVDDLHGWDFFDDDNSIYDGEPGDNDTDSHGTHVSGTIGAVGNNGIGVAGVNWNVTIISGKFLGPSGGTTAAAVKALDYFTDLKRLHGLNIVATNNSWGGGGYSQAMHEAIIRAANEDILFVAAAGNGNMFGQALNNDTTANYPSNYNTTVGTPNLGPASYDAVIAVTALTSTGAKASWANYGKTTVDLGAPGSAIYSTTPNATYSSFSGTSMATPHVTGAAALYAAMNPGSPASVIRAAILNSTTFTTSLNGITVTNGRLNIGNFLPPPPPPAAPGNLTAAPASQSQINLAWADNSDNEEGFYVERCTGAGCGNFAQIGTVGANVTAASNTGLAANTTYRYRVRAFNAGGASDYSLVAEATTFAAPTPPAAPSSLTATPGASSGKINLNWQDNAGNEQGFKIERCQGTSCNSFSQIATVGANVTAYTDSNRTRGRWYRYRVRAYNATGNSAYSNIATAKAP